MSEETTVPPEAVSTPASDPAPAAAAAEPTGPGRTRKATGMLGQVVGIVGMVVCLALIVGVLFGRGAVTDAVTDVAGNIDAAAARAEPPLDAAAAGVDLISQKLGEVATAAETVAVDPNATPEAIQAVIGRLGAVSQRYLELRSAYSGARERVVSALDGLAVLDRFMPGTSVPQGPIDALASLDTRASELDGQVMTLINAGTATGAANTTVTAIAERSRAVQAGLEPVSASIEDVQATVAGLRAEIVRVADTANTVITIVSLVLVVVLLYLTLLHFVLFRSSRGQGRSRAAA